MSEAATTPLPRIPPSGANPHASATVSGLHRPLLRLLADGEPVTVDELAGASGRPVADVARTVERWHDAERDDAGRIVGLGITLRPTAHRFTVDGRDLYTWCALDTLMFPAIIDRTAMVE